MLGLLMGQGGVAHLQNAGMLLWFGCTMKKEGFGASGQDGYREFRSVQQEFHQWSDRRKLVTSVLLPMMVFVHVDPRERMEVLSFSTVSRYMVMRGESSPAVIPDEQMARFRFMLDYSEESISMNSAPWPVAKRSA